MEKKVMTGNQAIARGFWEAGGRVAASYPGSPTVELMENLQTYPDLHAEFSVNEKVALEVAMGGSIYGSRSMVSMKHVGVNIAMDPLMTFTQIDTNGGFLLMVGDDAGMSSSQNEQDSRAIAKFANMFVMNPATSQEAKDYTKIALDLSEEYGSPGMLLMASRACHARGIVELEDRKEYEPSGFSHEDGRYTMLPPYTHKAQYFMKERLAKLEELAYDAPFNKLEEVEGASTLIIAPGMMYDNLKEIGDDLPFSIYKPGMVYPLSMKRMKEFSEKYERIIVIEELLPFIENELVLAAIPCEGKKYFSFTGELFTEDIFNGLLKAGILTGEERPGRENPVVARPPMFCAGCPHRPVFDVLRKAKAQVIGDIGCYSMSVLPAINASQAQISMGATVGMTKGMAKAKKLAGDTSPTVSVIGDGTFFHSGMTGYLNLLHKIDPEDNMTFIVLDNSATAMTGGQPNASSGLYNEVDDIQTPIEKLLEVMGHDKVHLVDQFNYNELKETIKREMNTPGISVIITTRPCALKYKIQETTYYVDPKTCIGCRTCVKTNCPPIRMKEYKGIDKLKSFIDPDMCVGCSTCAQVCPVGAIKKKGGQ